MARKAKEAPSESLAVKVDQQEFIRTRNALTTAWLSLSTAIDRAVKAYIEHTDTVIEGGAPLDIAQLSEPLRVIGAATTIPSSIVASAEAPEAIDDQPVPLKKRKRKNKPRDPNAPKRPLTAYFRYLDEARPSIKLELKPDGSAYKPVEISRLATERWKALDEQGKQPYHDAYAAEKIQYNIRRNAYLESKGIDPSQHVSDDEDEVAPIKIADVTGPGAVESSDDSDSSDDGDSSDDEVPPVAPPKPRKSSSPETVMKTPKSSKKAVASSPGPQFNSINPNPPRSTNPSSKKRKSEATGESGDPAPVKRPRGRPPKSSQPGEVSAKKKKKKHDADES